MNTDAVPPPSVRRRVAQRFLRHSSLVHFVAARLPGITQFARKILAPSGSCEELETEKLGHAARLTVALTERIRHIANANGSEFLVLAYCSTPVCDTALGDLLEKGITSVRVTEAEGWSPESMLFFRDGHWNDVGHKFVADLLTDVIIENI